MKNPCGVTRKLEEPYEIWKSPDGTWEWRVLKKNQSPEGEAQNPNAIWFCAVRSPHTFGGWEMGSCYVRTVTFGNVRVK